MPRNVEIKARIDSLERCRAIVDQIADGPPERLDQDDTFFGGAVGRLKLRVFGDGEAELIHYRRADTAGPKTSSYVRVPVEVPDALRECLAAAYGVTGRVVKTRRVYLVGRTRVHLDDVEGLGTFVELEVVLGDSEDVAAGEAEARGLMSTLGIDDAELVEGAYVDLLTSAR